MRPLSLLRASGAPAAVLVAFLASAPDGRAQDVTFFGPIDQAQEVPPSGSPGTGQFCANLHVPTNTFSWTVSYGGLTGPATAAHFHVGAPGVGGQVQIGLGTANPNVGSQVVSAQQASDILAGDWYVNIHTGMFPNGEIRGQVVQAPALGATFCSPAVANSTGSPGVMTVNGSAIVADDCLTLVATQLPPTSNIGYFLMGTGTNTFVPPGSAGPICIAPGLQRYLPPVCNTSELPGGFSRVVGTSGPVSGNITVGSTWSFQAWHRDGMSPSNLTDAVSVSFN